MSETTLDKLKHSLDIRYYKSRILLFAIVYIFLTIVSSIDVFFLCILDEDNDILFQLMMVIIFMMMEKPSLNIVMILNII